MKKSSFAAVVLASLVASSLANGQKLRVYILAGQSNMQGHAKVATLEHMQQDEATRPLLAKMRKKDGAPRVSKRVWIANLTGGRGGEAATHGKLTAGWGARRNAQKSDDKFGPEWGFGVRMEEAYDGPILLIKTAWGGKSLHTDFRSPAAGPYPIRQDQLDAQSKRGKDPKNFARAKIAATGVFYRKMMKHVRAVLADPSEVCPAYKKGEGYELKGFVWFQGWNDMVDRGTYPKRDQEGGYAAYSECMGHFIRDVRKELDAPSLPFVIGVMGVGGPIRAEDAKKRRVHANFRAAMAAPASLAEFKANVFAVQTAPFWDLELDAIAAKMGKVRNMARMLRIKHKKHANRDGKMSKKEQRAYVEKYRSELLSADEMATWQRGASNAGYHYLGCGKTMARIGVAFADALLGEKSGD